MARKSVKTGRKPIMKQRATLTVYVEADQKRRLEKEAARQGVSAGALVRQCIAALVG